MTRGTPLKKFGNFRVHQVRKNFWEVYDDKDERVCFSDIKLSAYLAAERLEAGEEFVTPKDSMDCSLASYPTLYPCKLRYYDHLYLVIGNGFDWIHGCLASEDVSLHSEVGRREHAAKEIEREKSSQEKYARVGISYENEGDAIRAQYASGEWPDVLPDGKRTNLYPASENYSALAKLAYGDVKARDPWIEDARCATQILLKYGTNDPTRAPEDTIGKVREWALACQTRYGGTWLPSDQ